MALCAHVNITTNIVENLIVADPAFDNPWPGYMLVADPPPHVVIGTGWLGDRWPPAPTSKPAVPDGVESL